MRRLFAIGDIHGHIKELEVLLDWLETNTESVEVKFLGDVIDRGPNAKAVMDRIMHGPSCPQDVWDVISGNHEQMMYEGCTHPNIHDRVFWTNHGGEETLHSFGEKASNDELEPYLDWIRSLPYWLETENHYFVHGGIYPGVHPKDHGSDIVHWLRNWEDDQAQDQQDAVKYEKHVVYGHTNRSEVFRRPWCTGLDTGSGKGGKLTMAASLRWRNSTARNRLDRFV